MACPGAFTIEITMLKNYRILIALIIVMVFILGPMPGCENADHVSPNSTNGKTTALFNPTKIYGSLTDQEGNIYKTITIGSQTWMAENLRTTRYRNGENIPEETDDILWHNLKTGAYCIYQNTKSIDTIATYGRLYNWFAVNDSRNIAPEGWHVPTLYEWKIMENFLGGDTIAGGKLKESGTIHWRKAWNTNTTNESGFTALPGGYRVGTFYSIGEFAYWWTATEGEENIYFDSAWHRHVFWFGDGTGGCDCPKYFGKSVRCVKD
jgi:uncharacterized protein (TIGR02145 family)